jgi:hypothetical protein
VTNRNKRRSNKGKAKPQPQKRNLPSTGETVALTVSDSLQSPHAEQGDKSNARQGADKPDSNQEIAKPYRRIETVNIVLMLIFTAALVTITGINACYSKKQLNVIAEQGRLMNAALEETKRTREIENAAYLFATHAILESPVESGKYPVTNLEFENTGRTPALHTRINALSAFFEKRSMVEEGELPPATIPLPYPSEGVFPPGGKVPGKVSPPNLSKDNLIEASQAGFTLYVWGTIDYEDIFGKPHRTEFCFANQSNDVTTFTVCSRHNSYK